MALAFVRIMWSIRGCQDSKPAVAVVRRAPLSSQILAITCEFILDTLLFGDNVQQGHTMSTHLF